MRTIKKSDSLIAVSAITYGILFYQQSIGINYTIFTILQMLGLYFKSDTKQRNGNWWLAFTGAAFGAIGALWIGSLLAAIGSIVSIVILAALTINNKSSVIVSLFNGIYSFSTGLFHIIGKFNTEVIESTDVKSIGKNGKKAILFVASLLVALLFLILYRSANDQFKALTDKIDLSFISIGWIVFTLVGYYLIYFTYNQRNIEKVQTFDTEAPNDLADDEATNGDISFMSLPTQVTWAKMLLVMLNVLVLSVNFLDLTYFTGMIPVNTELDYSANVHSGVNAIIFSIVLAVGIILFFFHGKINFIKDNKTIKRLAQIWIVQNAGLILFTALRNVHYVEAYFLTYKRIGVFFYLAFCLIGLFYTFVKISTIKTNWFLVRKVSWSIYALAIVTPIINWDALIINYNFEYAESHPKDLDLSYLSALPEVNTALINQKIEESSNKEYYLVQFENSENYGIDQEIRRQRQDYSKYDWRSFNIRGYLAQK